MARKAGQLLRPGDVILVKSVYGVANPQVKDEVLRDTNSHGHIWRVVGYNYDAEQGFPHMVSMRSIATDTEANHPLKRKEFKLIARGPQNETSKTDD